MDSENVSSAESSPAPQKPPRSKVERAIVWTLIGALIVVTGMEFLSKTGYSKTLDNLEEANTTPEQPLTLNYFLDNLKSGLAIRTKGEHEGRSTILFKWPSLVKKYELHLTVSPDDLQTLTTYATTDGPAGIVNQPRPEGLEDVPPDSDIPAGPPASHGEAGGPPQRPEGAGGPRGGAMRSRSPLRQLLSEAVAAELSLTDEQKTQIQGLIENQPSDPGGTLAERAENQEIERQQAHGHLKGILDEAQFARARQILLHRRGVEALTQEDVAEEIPLSPEQREQIAVVVATQWEKAQELIEQRRELGPAVGEKMSALREETKTQVLALLSEEQKKSWETLLGPAPPESERRSGRPQ